MMITDHYHPWVIVADASAVSVGFGIIHISEPMLYSISLMLSIVWMLFRFGCDPVIQKFVKNLWTKVTGKKKHRRH